MPAADTRRAVVDFIVALNSGDADRIAGCVSAEFANEHTSARGQTVIGRDAYRERLTGFLAAFGELHYELEELLVDGDRAAAAYRMTALMAVDGADPVPIDVRGVFRFGVAEGLVAHRVDYWDGEVVAAQLAASTGRAGS